MFAGKNELFHKIAITYLKHGYYSIIKNVPIKYRFKTWSREIIAVHFLLINLFFNSKL